MTNPSGIWILVLDDEPVMLEIIRSTLFKLGFTDVATCDSGRQALDRLDGQGTDPDLILLDLNMPGMDGVEFLRKLVERHYAGSVILVSGDHLQCLPQPLVLLEIRSDQLPVRVRQLEVLATV